MFTYMTTQNLYNQVYNQMYIQVYNHVYNQGQWGKIWSKLTGRSRRLLNLDEVSRKRMVRSRVNTGLQTVSIRQIQGSESRSHDFDRDFNPLQNINKERWLSAALAWQYNKPMPAVQLIQIGDIYFVRDGHHRISVARAMGQQEIDAEVTVWQVNWPRWLSATQFLKRLSK